MFCVTQFMLINLNAVYDNFRGNFQRIDVEQCATPDLS